MRQNATYYSVFGIHLGQNRDGKQGRLGILLSLTVVKSAVSYFATIAFEQESTQKEVSLKVSRKILRHFYFILFRST
jgi:hypothetical protein